MTDWEDLLKAGIILILGAVLFSGTFLTAQLANTFTNLGTFMIVMAIIIAILSFLVPILRRLF